MTNPLGVDRTDGTECAAEPKAESAAEPAAAAATGAATVAEPAAGDVSGHWRQAVAPLAHPHGQTVFARLVLGSDLDDALATIPRAKRAGTRASLAAAGLIDAQGMFQPRRFRALLAEAAPPRPTGIGRFVQRDRVVRFPSGVADRDEVIVWLAHRVLAPDESVDERELGARLGRHVDDIAYARRLLVDTGALERRPDGTGYRRASTPER